MTLDQDDFLVSSAIQNPVMFAHTLLTIASQILEPQGHHDYIGAIDKVRDWLEMAPEFSPPPTPPTEDCDEDPNPNP